MADEEQDEKKSLADYEQQAAGMCEMCESLMRTALEKSGGEVDPHVAAILATTHATAIQAIAMCRFANVAETAFGAFAKTGK